MRIATLILLSVLLVSISPAARAAEPAGNDPVVISFAGGSVWTSGSTGTCIWYFPVLGNLALESLFETDGSGNPIIDKQHAYLIWVSDWSIAAGFSQGPLSLAVLPSGQATIYYSATPEARNFSDPANRSTWGTPVATFVRGGSLFQSPDNWASDKFFFTATLASSKSFPMNGRKPFNLREVIQHSMTCFEYGANASTSEAGTCFAVGSD